MQKYAYYTVLSYRPEQELCDLRSASQSQDGVLYDVPIACNWTGAWKHQIDHPVPLNNIVSPGDWGDSIDGPQWGISFPIQEGDLVRVEFLEGEQSSPIITQLMGRWGFWGIAHVGTQMGESPFNRFDLLHPSGAWLRCLEDGTWIVTSGKVNAPRSTITITPDGTVRVDTDVSVLVNTVDCQIDASQSATINTTDCTVNADKSIEMESPSIKMRGARIEMEASLIALKAAIIGMAAEQTSSIEGGVIEFNTLTKISGKEVCVVGGRDSDNDRFVSSGQ